MITRTTYAVVISNTIKAEVEVRVRAADCFGKNVSNEWCESVSLSRKCRNASKHLWWLIVAPFYPGQHTSVITDIESKLWITTGLVKMGSTREKTVQEWLTDWGLVIDEVA